MPASLLIATLALACAGLLRSPVAPLELTTIPAHELFYAALGAAQLMTALLLLWQRKTWALWLGVLLSGGHLTLAAAAWLLDVPFTHTAAPLLPGFVLALLADGIALIAVLVVLPEQKNPKRKRRWRTPLLAAAASIALGGSVWGAALIAEPHLPDLAHDTVDQFARFDAAAWLVDTEGYQWDLPPGFPVPPVPANNPMTEAKVELGRHLFYDTRLSGNNSMACASCHHQERAFSDGLAVPIGSTGEAHVRNSQTLTNVAYNASYTWGNPVLTELEQQVVIPLFGEFPIEMGVTGNEALVLSRLQADARYAGMFAAAFPDSDNPLSYHHVVQALSSFVRSMISGHSAYDRFVYQGERAALSDSALRGLDLFLSEKFECHHCHGGFNFSLSTRHAGTTFSEQAFFNTGLYNVDGAGAYPRGNTGVFEITGAAQDMGRFRPPTLRNVALTAPYMHDGSIATLAGVIQFYADGGRVISEGPNAGDGTQNPYKSGFVPGFEVSAQEMADLIAFLNSLTDTDFVTDPAFSNPFDVADAG